MDLKRWFRREPHPAVILADGRKVVVPSGPRKWAELEETISSLGASKLEALGQDGSLLRVTNLEVEESAPSSSVAAKSGEPEYVTIARIIADSNDRACARLGEAYTVAFAENTKLVGILADRLSALETAWVGTINQLAEERMAKAEEGENAMIGTVVAAMAAGEKGKVSPIRKGEGKKLWQR